MARAEELARDPVTGDRSDDRPHAPGRVEALAERVRPTDLARDRRLPVLAAFDALLPASGLRRGTTVAVDAGPGVAGATSLALAVAAGASQAGSWVAAVGLGSLGLVAASELGVAFERLVLVGPRRAHRGASPASDAARGVLVVDAATAAPSSCVLASDAADSAIHPRALDGRPLVADPGRERAGWASVVAALVDGFDVVLVAAEGRLRAADARRLVARVRERGAVLVAVGGELPGERSALRLTVTSSRWEGLGAGWGHLQGRRVTVEAGGRGEASRDRRAELWLPGPEGTVAAVEPVAEPIPLRPRRSRRPTRGPELSKESARDRASAPTAGRPGPPSPPPESA